MENYPTKKKKILYLGLCLWRVLLGINSLEVGITSLGLSLRILSLRDHVRDREIILRLIGLDHWLDLLALSSPY